MIENIVKYQGNFLSISSTATVYSPWKCEKSFQSTKVHSHEMVNELCSSAEPRNFLPTKVSSSKVVKVFSNQKLENSSSVFSKLWFYHAIAILFFNWIQNTALSAIYFFQNYQFCLFAASEFCGHAKNAFFVAFLFYCFLPSTTKPKF